MVSRVRWYIAVPALVLLIVSLAVVILEVNHLFRHRPIDLGDYILSKGLSNGGIYVSIIGIVYIWHRGETGYFLWSEQQNKHEPYSFLLPEEEGYGVSVFEVSNILYTRSCTKGRRLEVTLSPKNRPLPVEEVAYYWVEDENALKVDNSNIREVNTEPLKWGYWEVRKFEYRKGMGRLGLGFVTRAKGYVKLHELFVLERKPEQFPEFEGKFPWE